MVIVLTGTPGADRSTLGRSLASELGWQLVECDDRQPSAIMGKLRRGQPLTRPDRGSRIGRIRAIVERLIDRREHAVVVSGHLEDVECLALRSNLKTVRFVHLMMLAAGLERTETPRGTSDTPSDPRRSGSSELHQETQDGIRIGITKDLSRTKNLSGIVRRIRIEFGL